MSKPKSAIPSPASEIEADADSSQRWTARRKAAAARQHALTLAGVEQCKDDFITQGTEALRSHPRDLAQQFEAERKTLLAKVGKLTLHVDVLKKRMAISVRTCRTAFTSTELRSATLAISPLGSW